MDCLCDIARHTLSRIVTETQSFVVFCPFSITELCQNNKAELQAEMLKPAETFSGLTPDENGGGDVVARGVSKPLRLPLLLRRVLSQG